MEEKLVIGVSVYPEVRDELIVYPHPPFSSVVRLTGDSGAVTKAKYEDNHLPVGVQGAGTKSS